MKTHLMNPHNHDIPAPDAAMLNVQLDGQWVQVPAGLNVIETAKRFGKTIPHYCYHPKLEVVGNCRMCLFEMGLPKRDAERKIVLGKDGKPKINWLPRPQIACATKVCEGMGIRTQSELVKNCQNGVMEFLLINHPLDCPICDQAGECRLQEFSVQFGTGESRFVEKKVNKPKNVDLGERIVLDDERCILCSRCIRFARDVVHDDVLGFIDRGSYNKLAAHPDRPFDNDYSLNTVDICPVGALTSKDFRFKMRTWFLKETESVCTGCGTGCNVTISSREDTVYRLTPRVNEEVNSHWMCDFGRLNFHDLDSPHRLKKPMARVGNELIPTTWSDIYSQIGRRVSGIEGHEAAVIASARMTNEELFLLRKWTDAIGASLVDIVPREWEGDSFLKTKDRNPNSTGARLLGVSQGGKALSLIRNHIEKGKIKARFVFHEDVVEAGIETEWLGKLSLLVTVGILPNETTKRAHFVLPGSGFSEKSGTMVNVNGRLQRLRRAVLSPDEAMDDLEILRDLEIVTAGKSSLSDHGPCDSANAAAVSGINEIFRAMSAEHKEFSGIAFDGIGSLGVPLTAS